MKDFILLVVYLLVPLYGDPLRWPITTTAITKRNTINKENFINQKVLLTYKKGLLRYKQDLLTYARKYSLTYTKNPRQIATANSHGK